MFEIVTVCDAGDDPEGVVKLKVTGATCIVADWVFAKLYVPPLLKPGTASSWPSSSP